MNVYAAKQLWAVTSSSALSGGAAQERPTVMVDTGCQGEVFPQITVIDIVIDTQTDDVLNLK